MDFTHSQLRMWFMHTIDPRRTDLTIACAARLHRRLGVAELQERLLSVVESNPLLSATVAAATGDPQWRVVEPETAVRGAVRPALRAGTAAHVDELYTEFVNRAWQLDRDVPWAVQLVTTGTADFLFCAFHHLVCDGDRSLRLFLDGLSRSSDDAPAPALADLLTNPPRAESWDDAIARLTAAVTDLGDPRERLAETSPAGTRWSGVVGPVNSDADERDDMTLLRRLRSAVAHLLGEGQQTLVAIPFDECTPVQRNQIGYFGNPGLAVLPAADPRGSWAGHEYARAEELAGIPFQNVMSDEGFRAATRADNPFDILLVPRSLFTYSSALVRSVSEPTVSHTPYALVLNHWRDGDGWLRVTLESAVFGQEVLDHLGSALGAAPDEPVGWPVPGSVDGTDLITRLEAVVAEHRDAVAIETPSEERLTYGELWAHAAELAGLVAAALTVERRTVAIVGIKHPNEIVGVLGTHMAGGTVLRLDRDEPATRRIIAGLHDLAAVVRLDDTGLDGLRDERVVAGPFGDYRFAVPESAPEQANRPPAPSPTLYVTLTSGSTGQPKPVPFARAAFNSLLSWHLRTFPAPRRTLQFSKLSFDVAYHVVYATLCGGGTLITANTMIREDPEQFLAYLDVARVQKLYLPTVLLRPIAEHAMAGDAPAPAPALREVIVAGGGLEITDDIRTWFTHTSADLFNHYGMSETQDVTSYQLPGPPASWPARPPVGLPIDGVDVRVTGAGGRPLPASLTGAVVVRTVAGETATGDLGYRDAKDLLHIVGRADRVIKRRGFRVNLQALEATVARVPGISAAVAVAYPVTHGGTTVAVVATAERQVDTAGVATEVAATLGAGYEFELLLVPEIPRLANSKPDLVEITRTVRGSAGRDTGPPARQRPVHGSSAVLTAVRELVGDATVAEDARFLDAGLDSISLMSLATTLRSVYPGLTVADFFKYPTIAALQQRFDHSDTAAMVAKPAPRRIVAGSEVAVIGMAGRFPGASDVDTFWDNLLDGRSALEPASTEDSGDDERPAAFVGVHGTLSGVDEFDHAFFGISPAEARRMDPQVRVFLELCWHALEDAGEAGDLTSKHVGIFAGSGMSTYLMNEIEPDRLRTEQTPFLEHNTLPQRLGNDRNYLTSTVSYRLGLTGPSIVVLAACATSLTAVHMARQALLNGECDIALAGGVSIIYPQPAGYEYVDGSVRSRTGECRPFDRYADGSVFGNGAGVVVLKRAEDATTDRNTVYAEVLGSAVNHDGSVKGSFSAPNPASQSSAIDAALRSAGAGDLRIDFVEAHGSATSIGDAIEWHALLASEINRSGTRSAPCVVGSVKGNVGHLDEAAGIAGFIKACLAVRDRRYPATHGFTELHPNLAATDRFTVSAKVSELPRDRRVHGGVSSFGMGGANCHVVVRSPEPDAAREPSLAEWAAPLLLPVSARTRAALTDLADRIGGHLDREADLIVAADVVRTLSTGRTHFDEFRGVLRLGPSGAVLVTPGETADACPRDRRTTLVWAFPGQGSGFSWAAVSELSQWPVFARAFDDLLAGFADRLGPAFVAHIGELTGGEPIGGCSDRCTVREQVLQFSFQLALARLLASFGVEPDAVVGHSLGEITAAVCAGRLAEPAALALVARRAVLMDAAAGDGFMAQLRCDREQAGALAAALDLDVAAFNGPHQTVVAGGRARAEELVAHAARRDVDVTLLPVGKAFHSRMMRDAAARLADTELGTSAEPATAEFIGSNAAGGDPSDIKYWTDQLTAPVDYVNACDAVLARQGRTLVVEVGFGATLANLLRAVAADRSVPSPALAGGVRGAVTDYLGSVAAAAHQAGVPLSWTALNRTGEGRLVPLPRYPFERTTIVPGRTAARAEEFELSPADEDWIAEHRVDGRCVVPAAGILALFARAARRHGSATALTDITFERPIVFESDSARVAARVSVGAGASPEITLSTRPAGSSDTWVRDASAVLTPGVPAAEPIVEIGEPRHVSTRRLYARFTAQRLEYGARYRCLDAIEIGAQTAAASWLAPAEAPGRSRIGLTTELVTALDGVIQLADALDDPDHAAIRMPAHIAYAAVHTGSAGSLSVHAHREPGSTFAGSLRGGHATVADLTGIRYQVAPTASPVAHRPRWREHIPVGAELPIPVADELARLSTRLSTPDPEVTEYQRQVRVLEAHAVRTLSKTGPVLSEVDDSESAATRRTRALRNLMNHPRPVPAESPGGAVTAEWQILENAAGSLPEFFSGALDGETILFGGDGQEHLRSYYQNSFLLNRLNHALPDVVLAVARANAPRRIRILEVGGGTGASTERVLDALDDADLPVDYTFTDLSDGLVRLATTRFGQRPGFRAATVDLESDAAMSALDTGYDVVVAVDVIHATKDVGSTVDRLADRLAPNGMLLMVEDLKPLAWVDLTFGLLDSWWSFDDRLRTDHPLLPIDTWRRLLASRFGHVDVLRACGALPIDDTTADEGLFVCANPNRGAQPEPVVLDLPVGTEAGDRLGALASARVAVVRFDTPAVLDPAEAEWFAATMLDVLRAAEEHSGLTHLVVATADATLDGDTPRVRTAGSMAAALTRVAAAEKRRVRVLSLAMDAWPGTAALTGHVRALLTHGHPFTGGAIIGGRLHLPYVAPEEEPPPGAPDHDAVVVFGATSELATATGEWLHTHAGIDRVYLVGRSAPPQHVEDVLARLTDDGAEARYLTADVTDLDAVRAVAETVSARSARPLVLNLTAVLRDAAIDRVGAEDLAAVLGPKVRGSHNIATAFGDLDARLVLFSSTTALLGNAGQAAHAMACAYLDGLAESAPAAVASVQWGPWSDIGITARLGMNDRLRAAGENPAPAAVLLPELRRAAAGAGGVLVAADLGSPLLRAAPFRGALLPPLRDTGETPTRVSAPATTPAAGSDVVAWAVASVLGVPLDAVATDRTLADNGVDSLNLIEVRSLLEQRTGVRVPLNALADAPSLTAVRDAVAPVDTGPVLFYVAGIFGPLDAAPDLEDALTGSARLVTLSSPTREPGSPERLDLTTVAGDLADQIEREQPAGPVTVAGHSFGARLAYAVGVELRRRGRDLRRVVMIDGDPVAVPDDRNATDTEFETLMEMRAGGTLSPESRAVAEDAYRANCAIARSHQNGESGRLACPVRVVVPARWSGVGLEPSRVAELRENGHEELGGTEIEIAEVPGDHFTMLRSPNVTRLVEHLTEVNSGVRI